MPTDEYDVPLSVPQRRGSDNQIPEMTLDDLKEVLGTTIKYDDTNKCIVFLGMLSTYTEEDQLNVCLLGESSSGKTYLADEVSSYFPKEDVLKIADATPKSFKYLEDRLYRNEETGEAFIDLERVILLFQDMPGSELLKNLRTLMSHDDKNLKFYNVNMNQQGRRATESVTMIGFPSVTFCSANMRIDPQEATRCILLSPEVNDEKINASVKLAVEKATNPEEHKRKMLEDNARNGLKRRIEHIKNLEVKSVLLPVNPGKIIERFRKINPKAAPRDSRDIKHIISLIKAVTMLNAGNRQGPNGNILANENDVASGFKLWEGIAKTQECGVAPAAMEFYEDFIIPAYMETGNDHGITISELIEFCKRSNNRISPFTITKNFVPTLVQNGMISYERVTGYDGRSKFIKPLELPSSPKSEGDPTTFSDSFCNREDQYWNNINNQEEEDKYEDLIV